jgi:hypothetical protein
MLWEDMLLIILGSNVSTSVTNQVLVGLGHDICWHGASMLKQPTRNIEPVSPQNDDMEYRTVQRVVSAGRTKDKASRNQATR